MNNRDKRNDAFKTIVSSLISILLGFIFGGILLFIISLANGMSLASAWDGFRIVLAGVFNRGRIFAEDGSSALAFGVNLKLVGDMLFRATPLIMTGLSVGLAYKTGLFNIGAAGQYLMGTMASIIVALSINTSVVPPIIVWILAILAAAVAGALWGAIPGAFKAFLNVNEVITSIMTNWIAANLVTIVFENSSFRNMEEYGKTGYIVKLKTNGVASPSLGFDKLFAGSSANAGILVAIVIAVVIFIILNKTTLGYELKACGSNKFAAKYAGMNDKRNIILSMAIAGALSGIGAALYYLQGDVEFSWNTSMSLPAEGFNGIPVALLAMCHPLGIIFAGLFMSFISISGTQLSNLTAYNEYIANIIVAVIVYFSAFSLFFKLLISKKRKKDDEPTAAADSENDGTSQNDSEFEEDPPESVTRREVDTEGEAV